MPRENMVIEFTCPNKDCSFQSLNTHDFIGHNCTTAGENPFLLSINLFQFTLSDQSLKPTRQDRRGIWDLNE